jgi:hypothetical protein
VVAEKNRLLDRLRTKYETVKTQVETKNKEHLEKQRELFYIKPAEKITINLDIPLGDMIESFLDTHLKPQKEFLEKLWNIRGGRRTYKFKVEGRNEGGGTQYSFGNRVEIGIQMIGTTPLHEFAHAIEDLTPQAKALRAEEARKIVLKYTGKSRIEEVELEKWVSHVDSQGTVHYYTGRHGEFVFVPKGMFNTPEENRKYGYMFRVYDEDINQTGYGRGTKYHIRENVSSRFGIEMTSVGTEKIYKEPRSFANQYPEVFDMVVDLYRGKIT